MTTAFTGAHARGRAASPPDRVLDRFHSQYVPEAIQTLRVATPCDIWIGPCTNSGYGTLNWSEDGVCFSAYMHHLAYRLGRLNCRALPRTFDDGNDVIVSHRCDVKACVNWQHLYLGRRHDNLRDYYVRGKQDPAVVDAVKEIRRAFHAGDPIIPRLRVEHYYDFVPYPEVSPTHLEVA